MKQNNASIAQKEDPHHKSSQTQKAFNVWGIVLAIWAVYRSTVGATAPLVFDELILKPLLFIGPVLFYIKNFEHKTLVRGLWLEKGDWSKHWRISAILCTPVFLLFAIFLFFSPNKASFDSIFILLPIAFGMSVSEEILSRGFVARHIWEESKNVFKTMVVASLLHMFLRIPRILTTPELFGEQLILFIIADLILSVVLTAIFLWRKSLAPVILVRFLYSFLLMSMLV